LTVKLKTHSLIQKINTLDELKKKVAVETTVPTAATLKEGKKWAHNNWIELFFKA
jgi:hypothetical protein